MKRFNTYVVLVVFVLAAFFTAGCSVAAGQSAEPSADVQTDMASSGTDEGESVSSEQPDAEEATAEQPSWAVVLQTDISHPTNMAGFLNEDFGVTVGYGGEVHYTNDAGQTWPEGENSSMCRFCLDIVDENIAWNGGNGDMVRVTHDGGQSWEEAADIAMGAVHSYIDFVDDTTGWIATLSKLAVTNDGGTTWSEMALPEGASGIAAICLRTPKDGYLLSHDGILYTTADGGATWSEQDLSLENCGIIDLKKEARLNKSNLAVADISFADESNGTVVMTGMSSEGGFKTVCLTTDDGGGAWELETLSELGLTPAKVFLTGDGKYLTLSSNNNQTVVLKRQD